jgi:hypothetical protein
MMVMISLPHLKVSGLQIFFGPAFPCNVADLDIFFVLLTVEEELMPKFVINRKD